MKDIQHLANSLAISELPNDKANEELLLAKLIQSPENAAQLTPFVEDEVFYTRRNQTLLKAIKSCVEEGSTPTISEIIIALDKVGVCRAIAPSEYDSAIETLEAFSYLPIHPDTDWVKVLEHLNNLATRRKAIALLDKKRVHLFENSDPTQVLVEIQTELQQILENHGLEDKTGHIIDVAEEWMDRLKEALTNPGAHPKCGIADLDAAIQGFRPGDFHVIAGCTNMGKSQLALAIALGLAQNGYSVFYLSVEMPGYQLLNRWAANITGINSNRVMNPERLSEDELEQVVLAKQKLKALPIYVHSDSQTFDTAIALANQQFQKNGQRPIDVVFYDTLQAGVQDEGEKATFRINALGKKLKDLAMQQNICAIGIAQINVAALKDRNSKVPTLFDISLTNLIQGTADTVWLMHSQDYWHHKETNERFPEGNILRNLIELFFQKNRHNELGKTALSLEKEYTRIKMVQTHHGGGFNTL